MNASASNRYPRRSPLAIALLAAAGLAGFARASMADTPVMDCTDGAASGTLRNVIATAPDGEIIDASACASSTITLAGGEIVVAQASLTINGPADGSLAISANHGSRVFRHATSGGTLTLAHLAVANGSVSGTGANQELYGGCIWSKGSVTLDHARVTGCSVSGSFDGDNTQGGGIFAYGAVTADYSTISDNTATSTSTNRSYAYGGGVDALNGFIAHHSSISGNVAAVSSPPNYGTGGGVSTRQTLTLVATTISGNTADHGGGVYFGSGTIAVDQSTFGGNSAVAQHGGGLLAHAPVTATNSTFSGNSAGGEGGAIYTSSAANLTNSTISGNQSGTTGGGVWTSDATLYFCTIFANRYTAAFGAGKGAGVYFTNSATANASIITGNGGDDIDAPSNIPLSGAYDIIAASGVGVPGDTLNCNVTLGPLANFGGSTKTMPLLSGSCAIDGGPFSPNPALDQRRLARPVQLVWPAPRADVGAFEKQSVDDPDYIFIDSFGATGAE